MSTDDNHRMQHRRTHKELGQRKTLKKERSMSQHVQRIKARAKYVKGASG